MAQIQSGDSSTLLTIDSASKAARVVLYDANGNPLVRADNELASNPSGIINMGINDVNATAVRTDLMGNIGQAALNPIFWEQCEGANLRTDRWITQSSVFGNANQTAAAGINMNSGATVTANGTCSISTRRKVARIGRSPLHCKFRLRLDIPVNSLCTFGLMTDTPAGPAVAVQNGIYFEVNAAGAWTLKIATNGAVSNNSLSISLDPTRYYSYNIVVDDDNVYWSIQNTDTGAVSYSGTVWLTGLVARFFSSTRLGFTLALGNSATAPARAPVMLMSYLFIGTTDIVYNRTATEVQVGNKLDCSINPATLASTVQYGNSVEIAAASLSNSAASYNNLQGRFTFAAVAGANTDYNLFGFAVPSGYTLVVKGITIDMWVAGAAIATTPTLINWFCVPNASSVNLSSMQTWSTKHHLGTQSFPIGAVPGTNATQINVRFNACGDNTFILGFRLPVATATASQTFVGVVHIDGYFE